MANKRFEPASPSEVRLLSELLHFPKGVSPVDLADMAGMERPSVYVHLRRLFAREFVKSKPDRSSITPGSVLYLITAKGRKARVQFAKNVGLKP